MIVWDWRKVLPTAYRSNCENITHLAKTVKKTDEKWGYLVFRFGTDFGK